MAKGNKISQNYSRATSFTCKFGHFQLSRFLFVTHPMFSHSPILFLSLALTLKKVTKRRFIHSFFGLFCCCCPTRRRQPFPCCSKRSRNILILFLQLLTPAHPLEGKQGKENDPFLLQSRWPSKMDSHIQPNRHKRTEHKVHTFRPASNGNGAQTSKLTGTSLQKL